MDFLMCVKNRKLFNLKKQDSLPFVRSVDIMMSELGMHRKTVSLVWNRKLNRNIKQSGGGLLVKKHKISFRHSKF